MLSLERATELNATMVSDEHLIIHAKNVCYAMGAMADYFGENREHWQAVGMLHDYDYEKYPEEHLQHTQEPLLAAGVFTVDELTGIIQACARMRPKGIRDLEIKSFMKKYKDKKFAAKCDRELIQKGCDLLGMEVREVAEICIEGMRPHAAEIGLEGTGEE